MNKESDIAVICNDAGGAEIISSWLKKEKKNVLAVLGGPAKEIFEKKKIK